MYPNRNKYSIDDYRKEIQEIMERNGKRITITKVLKECGISKGNYYSFINGTRPALSYAKLDLLLEALRRQDGWATNRQRLAAMSDENLAKFIEEKLLNDPDAKAIDVLKWLRSGDARIIYKER